VTWLSAAGEAEVAGVAVGVGGDWQAETAVTNSSPPSSLSKRDPLPGPSHRRRREVALSSFKREGWGEANFNLPNRDQLAGHGGQAAVAVFGDDDIIFNAYAAATGQVDAWLHGEDVAHN